MLSMSADRYTLKQKSARVSLPINVWIFYNHFLEVEDEPPSIFFNASAPCLSLSVADDDVVEEVVFEVLVLVEVDVDFVDVVVVAADAGALPVLVTLKPTHIPSYLSRRLVAVEVSLLPENPAMVEISCLSLVASNIMFRLLGPFSTYVLTLPMLTFPRALKLKLNVLS